MWPDGFPETFTSDNFRCRFMAEPGARFILEIKKASPSAGAIRADEAIHAALGHGQIERIDVQAGIIVDVEATPTLRTAEVNATRTMIERVEERFDLKPERLIGDMAYGNAELLGWMVNDKGIEPHVPVWDRTQRDDDTLSSSDFRWDEQADEYRCPQGKVLRRQWRTFKIQRTHVTKDGTILYHSRQADCATCPMKPRCASPSSTTRGRSGLTVVSVTPRPP